MKNCQKKVTQALGHMTYRPSVVNRTLSDVFSKHYVIKFIGYSLKNNFRFYSLVSCFPRLIEIWTE